MRFRFIRLAISAAFLIVFSAANPAFSKISPEDASKIMLASQVKEGMQGYGLTVFKGDKIEQFPVKVLGTLPKTNMGRPLILVRIGGPVQNQRQLNIAQGMSGSPIYIGGKVIGAIAYAGGFAREPLGLVTPIEDMLEAWDPNLEQRRPGEGEVTPLPVPLKLGESTITAVGFGKPGPNHSPTTAWFQPLASPVMTSGLSQKSLAAVGDKLGALGVNVKAGAGSMPSYAGSFKPGSAIGFSLATGDMDMTGVGTVTYVRGNDVLAFGHPFLMLGPIELPMTTAWVHDVFPSYEISYKLASPGKVVGSSVHDRAFGISGAVGKKADMLPISVNVKGSGSGQPAIFNCQVFRHPLYTPIITQIAVMEAIARFRPYPGESMARVTLNVSADEVGVVRRSNLVFNSFDITVDAMRDLSLLLSILNDNRFQPVKVNKISLDVEIFQTRQTMDIEKISIPKSIYEPGETIEVQVTTRPWKKAPVTSTISVKVPDNASDGRSVLAVHGGAQAGLMSPDAMQAPGMAMMPGSDELREATSVRQMVQRFTELNTNNQMVARLLLPSGSISVEGERLRGLPPAMENAIQSPKTSMTRVVRDDVKAAVDTSYFIQGLQALPVTIQKRNWTEKPTASPAVIPPPSSTPPPVSPPPPVAQAAPEGVDIEMASWLSVAEVPEEDEEVVIDEEDGESSSDTSETADEETSASRSLPEKNEPEKPSVKLENVGRVTQRWLQTTADDFLKGRTEGIAISSRGALAPGHSFARFADSGQPYIWSIAPGPDGSLYAGTGSQGRVIKVTAEGNAEPLFETDGSQVSCLLATPDGSLYAGVSPSGSIYRYQNGKAEVVAQLPAKHPSSIVADNAGSIYLAAGDSGRVWRLPASDPVSISVFTDTMQNCVQSLHFGKDGRLYAATAYKAGVWDITGGMARSLHVASEEFVAGIAANEAGVVYASAGPRGKVYRIEKGKAAVAVLDKLSSPSVPLAIQADGTLLAVDGDTIHRLTADDEKLTQKTETYAEVFALLPVGDVLYAATTNPGYIWKLTPATGGEFTSAVRDAERPGDWGKTAFTTIGDEKKVTLHVRNGNTPDPSRNWTAWTALANGSDLKARGYRYAQYKIKLGPDVKVDDVALWYMPANRAPTVKFSKSPAGQFWSGKQTVQWTGTDADGDKLTYDLYYSADNMVTWKPLDDNLGKLTEKPSDPADKPDDKPKDTKAESKPAENLPPVPDQAVIDDLKKKIAESPNVPDAIKKQIMDAQPILVKPSVRPGATPGDSPKDSDKSEPETTSKTSYSWDTAKVKDGDYYIKVRASDRLANGLEALSGEEISGPVRIVNKKPTVWILRKVDEVPAPAGSGNGKVYQLNGFANSEGGAPIQKVQFRINGKGDWSNAQAADGIFDGSDELFNATLFKLKPGKHEIEVRVEDLAGNTVSGKREFEIK